MPHLMFIVKHRVFTIMSIDILFFNNQSSTPMVLFLHSSQKRDCV